MDTKGLEQAVLAGKIPLDGLIENRVLVYALVRGDFLGIDLPEDMNVSGQTVLYVVLARGPECKNPNVVPGAHCIHISSAADSVTGEPGMSRRLHFIRETHILFAWDPDKVKRGDPPA